MATATMATPADVRAWAQENGFEIGDRGRISSEIVEAYNKKHRRSPFVSGDSLARQSEGSVEIKNVRRATREGKQVFVAEVAGTLTFTMPGE